MDLTGDLQNKVRKSIGDGDVCLEECELKILGIVGIEHIFIWNGRRLN